MSYGAIYKITNKNDGKCYIGKSIDPKRRWKQHIYSSKFNKEEYFFEILAEYDNKEDLIEAEEYWIYQYNSIKEGYNKRIHRKGRGRITLSLTEEYIKKLEVIAEKEYSDKSKLLRKWIDENFKDEWEDLLKKGGK